MAIDEARPRLDVSMVKKHNREIVFRHVFENQPVTRATIAADTGLSQGTVKTIVDEFLATDLFDESKDHTTAVGRKPHLIRVRPEARTFGVLNVTPERLEFYALDLTLQPLGPPRFEVPPADEPYSVSLTRFLASVRRDVPELAGVNVIVPGAYIPEEDFVACHIMPQLADVRIGTIVESTFGCTANIGEDVHIAALAEAIYPHRVTQPLFYFYAGSGVGGSYVCDGTVLMGADRMAGEIGQMTVGGDQRLEDLVNWPAFLRRCGIANECCDDTEAILAVVESDTAQVRAALDEVAGPIAEALQAVVCVLNPRSIVIGGPYGELGEEIVRRIDAQLRAQLMPEHGDNLQILSARGGSTSMVRGAAYALIDHVLDTFVVGGDA